MDENIASILIDIKGGLGELSGQLKAAMQKLVEHESRITRLESSPSSFKDDMLKLLMKALIIALTGLGSVVGAGSLLQQILEK